MRGKIKKLAHAVVADSLAQVIVLGLAAVVASSGSILSFLYGLPIWVVVAAATLAAGLLVPIVAGFLNSRLRFELEGAMAQIDELTKLVASLRDEVEAGTKRETARAAVDRLEADLLATILGHDQLPTPAWATSPLEFERWLNEFTKSAVRVILGRPDEAVGLAIIRERDERYEFVHRTSDVPPEIVRLHPAPVHADLFPCIRRHAPYALTFFGRTVNGYKHWIVVFPRTEVEWPMAEAPLQALAEIIIGAYARHLEMITA